MTPSYLISYYFLTYIGVSHLPSKKNCWAAGWLLPSKTVFNTI